MKFLKFKKSKKLKNQALFKKGGYAVLITALVLAGLIVVNVLLSVLAQRVNLEVDMTEEKINSIDEDNIAYLESIENDVQLTVCAKEDEYIDALSSYYYSQVQNGADYYNQTLTLLKKYPLYNDKITLKFIDTQTNEFTEIAQKYSSYDLSYGDIIVTSKTKSGTERVKVVKYTDIYYIDTSDQNAYYYGYSISANKVETAVTSAISYVLTGKAKKAAFITGHSTSDNTSNYKTLLEANNYTVDIISSEVVNEIDSSYDLVAIMSASRDFIASEINALSTFLDNNDKLGKGLVYFADAACPSLPNLYAFLEEWGIVMGEGTVFETETQLMLGDPSTFYSVPVEAQDDGDSTTRDPIAPGENIGYCITGSNVPMLIKEPTNSAIKTSSLMTTYAETAVSAPVGASKDWKDYDENDLAQYTTAAVAENLDYEDGTNPIKSYVIAFSSVQFIQSDWAEESALSNKNFVIWASDIAANVTESGMTFVSKEIGSESFASEVTEAGVSAISWIFVIIVPILTIAAGVVIFIRRKNAE